MKALTDGKIHSELQTGAAVQAGWILDVQYSLCLYEKFD